MDGSQAVGSAEDLKLLIEIGFGFVSLLLAAIGGLMALILYKLFDGIGELRTTFDKHVEDDAAQQKRVNRLYVRLNIEEDA